MINVARFKFTLNRLEFNLTSFDLRHMDKSVSNLVNALKRFGMYDDTILVFSSDNGGMYLPGMVSNSKMDPNYPYKGIGR